MSFRYSPQEKAQALDMLHEHDGDIPYVSYLTGISERTLYSWRKQLKYHLDEQGISTAPKHWVRQQPDHQARLQQQIENHRLQQQQPQQMTVFGMTRAELEEALKPEFTPSPYADLRADLLLHLQHLNFNLTDDPETAHSKALAFSRILSDVLKLEELVRIEKPQLTLFKYEYPDQSYHDMPFWSNAVHHRATLAYDGVVAEAKRQYEEQEAAKREAAIQALQGNPISAEANTPETPVTALTSENSDTVSAGYLDFDDISKEYSLDELTNAPYKPDDFIPKHTGFHKYFLGEEPNAHFKDANTDSEESP